MVAVSIKIAMKGAQYSDPRKRGCIASLKWGSLGSAIGTASRSGFKLNGWSYSSSSLDATELSLRRVVPSLLYLRYERGGPILVSLLDDQVQSLKMNTLF